MQIIVSGCAGFIGAALSGRLPERGDEIVGVDNLNDYYDPGLIIRLYTRLPASAEMVWND